MRSSASKRDSDARLLELINLYPNPAATRVLDIGCAGGRYTVLLAQRGFDVMAMDASQAMGAETRRRVAETVGSEEAEARVRPGRMDDLGEHRDGSFDLVVALGVYHCAASPRECESLRGASGVRARAR